MNDSQHLSLSRTGVRLAPSVVFNLFATSLSKLPIAILVISALLPSAIAHYGYYGDNKLVAISSKGNGHNSASGCRGDYGFCRFWASNVIRKHPFMEMNCRKSCNTCLDDDVKIPVVLNMCSLVPALADLYGSSFYSYKGSLTTPPCFQSVNWIVLCQPIPATKKVMRASRTVKNYEGRPMCNNYRPVQPPNDHRVTLYRA